MTAPLAVAFAGLGVMGSGMATRLATAGHPITVYNRTRERADAVVAAGARAVDTPAGLAAGDARVVFVSVSDEGAVEQILFGADGLAPTLREGVLVCNLSTVSAEYSAALAERLAARDVRFLETTVLGNNVHALSGELRIYVGGPDEDLETARPVLDVLGKEVTHVGPLGAATTVKLALNLLMGIEIQALAEAVALAGSAGIEVGTILDAVTASGFCSPVMRFKAGAIAAGRFRPADFRLVLMRKDLDLAAREARSRGITLPATESARDVLDRAIADGLGDLDCCAVTLALQPAG